MPQYRRLSAQDGEQIHGNRRAMNKQEPIIGTHSSRLRTTLQQGDVISYGMEVFMWGVLLRRTFLDTYRSLSDLELLKLLQEPQSDFKPEARAALVEVAIERRLPATEVSQGQMPSPRSNDRQSSDDRLPAIPTRKSKSEPCQKKRDPTIRVDTSFDMRYKELREIDIEISRLQSSGLDDVETTNRIEEMERHSKKEWNDLYVDIINREG